MNQNGNRNNDCYPSYTLQEIDSRIRIKQTKGYTIYSYDKTTICFDAPIQMRQYRSVIFDKYGLTSFSPPRSIDYRDFCTMQSTIVSSIYINEIVEGIMIHLFYSKSENSWQIATKNAIGGNQVISNKTVRKMFMDIFPSEGSNISDLPLYRNYSYTLVLQHPNNLILLPIQHPALYVCAVYDISTYRAIYIPPPVYEEWSCFENTPFVFPRHFDINNIEKAKQYVESPHVNVLCMGLMATNLVTGDRCKLINPDYTDAMSFHKLDPYSQDSYSYDSSKGRDLKGTVGSFYEGRDLKGTVGSFYEGRDLKGTVGSFYEGRVLKGTVGSFYQYLCLHRIGRINEYILYFPKEKTAFMQFSKQYRNFAKGLHKSYILRYIQKEKPETKTKTKYTELVERLHHEIYLPSLRKNKIQGKIITLDIVREYMRGLPPIEMMHYLNYDQRTLENKN